MRITTGSDFPTKDYVLEQAAYAPPGSSLRRSYANRGWELPSIYDYGVVAGVDATEAVNAAWASLAAAGRAPILGIPPSLGTILISGSLNPPSGAGLVGLFGKPSVHMAGTGQSVISNPGFVMSGLTLIGDHSSSNYKFSFTSTRASVSDILLLNFNSCFEITGNRNDFTAIEGVNVRGAVCRISGGRFNTLTQIEGENVTSFLVYLTDGAAMNTVHRPRKKVSFSTLTAWQQANYASDISIGRFGLECVGITFDCFRNSVIDYYAEYTGDAAFSCSGYENTISGGRAVECEGNALTFIGSKNTAGNIISIGNKRGIACIPTAGGLSKDNVVTGCIAINNWFAGFTNENTQLREWQANTTFTAASSFCRYGLNNYQTADRASTSVHGSIPPTHTSGVVSDGVNDWRFLTSDPVTLNADRNLFIGCRGIGGGQGRGDGTGLNAGSGTDYYIQEGSGLNTEFFGSPGAPV